MIYFDNAATTFPKPISVVEEIRRCMLTYGGNPGRGAHSLSLRAAQKVFECRELAAETFGAPDSDRVFFTPNTTYGINAVLKGLLRRGDHVLISDMEHNAVYRPIHKMATEGIVEYDVFNTLTCDKRQNPLRICTSIARLIRPNTRLVFCTHASNICSETLPIAEIGAFCHRHGILFCVDGAQSAGHENIHVGRMNIDALCLPGHKGLYGPQGSGIVILGEGITLDTFVEGGNGIDSLSPDMPLQAPERYEAGTVATPCIAGLCEGLRTVVSRGVESISHNEKQLCRRACELLGNTKGITLYAPEYMGGIVLFNVDGVPSEKIAAALDTKGVCVRGGYHCAALAHRTLGTHEGGAVRLSFGMFNKLAEVDRFYQLLKECRA